VALAKTIVSKANFLMLDEPTNHLDMHSVELLAEALNKYEGTSVLVSHDRFFISKTANTIWEIVDHEIKVFKGGYEEWVEWKERREKEEKAQASQQAKEEKEKEKPVAVVKPQQQVTNATREQKKELEKLQRQFSKLEEQIEQQNKTKSSIEAELANPANYADRNKFAQIEADHKAIKQKIDQANNQYEALFEQIMTLEKQIG
jgi:ATP-binding cassette subfamily F protein 3